MLQTLRWLSYVKRKCKVSEKSSVAAGVVTLAVPAGDLLMRTTTTDATFTKGPSLEVLSVTVEKPGAFILDFNVPKKDVRFQFMNSAKVMGKPLNMTYTHFYRDARISFDCSLLFDTSKKLSVSHSIGSSSCKVKYGYTLGDLKNTVFESCYDTGKNVWDFVVMRKFGEGDAFRGTYNCSSQILGLDWSRNSKINGTIKVSASLNMAEENKAPKLMAEGTWNYEMFRHMLCGNESRIQFQQ